MSGPKARAIADRLWEAVAKSDGCWEWTGYRDASGYGRMNVSHRPALVHRIAYEITRGPIPANLSVLHACDNPPCVRPDHLWLGTQLDNIRDMNAKGRHVASAGMPGSRNPLAKLTEGDVIAIRSDRSQGMTYPRLAAKYGVSLGTVWGICERTKWRHVP